MTTQGRTRKEGEEKALTFKCQFCQQSKPLAEMVVLLRFFPPAIACRDCEKKLR